MPFAGGGKPDFSKKKYTFFLVFPVFDTISNSDRFVLSFADLRVDFARFFTRLSADGNCAGLKKTSGSNERGF